MVDHGNYAGNERNKDTRRERQKVSGQWMVVPVESRNCRNGNSRENQLQSQRVVIRELETEMIETIQLLV